MHSILITLFSISILNGIPIYAQHSIDQPELDSLRVETALCESSKFIWIGTNLGLLRYNKRTHEEWLLTTRNSNLPNNEITCIVCLTNGQTYIGTKNGLLFWDNYAFILINTENSRLPENHINSMTLDTNEQIWISTPTCPKLHAVGNCIKIFKLKNYSAEKKDKKQTPLISLEHSDLLTKRYNPY